MPLATEASAGIGCDLERQHALAWVESADRVDAVRSDVAAAREAGLPAPLVTAAKALRRAVAIAQRRARSCIW